MSEGTDLFFVKKAIIPSGRLSKKNCRSMLGCQGKSQKLAVYIVSQCVKKISCLYWTSVTGAADAHPWYRKYIFGCSKLSRTLLAPL